MANQDRQSAARAQRGSVVPLRPPQLASVREVEADDDTFEHYETAAKNLFRHISFRYGGLIRRLAIIFAVTGGVVMLGIFALWWRLASGPIQLDIVTPWLAAAIEQNFGSNRHVEVGGTQIERTETGGTAVRLRDIVVRDADGTIVASAPKAEVRLSGSGLLTGHMRAESLNLVGAEMAVRIEPDGGVTVFAGADKHPIAKAAVPLSAATLASRQQRLGGIARSAATTGIPPASALTTAPSADAAPAPQRRVRDVFAALLSWIDDIGETGLCGPLLMLCLPACEAGRHCIGVSPVGCGPPGQSNCPAGRGSGNAGFIAHRPYTMQSPRTDVEIAPPACYKIFLLRAV